MRLLYDTNIFLYFLTGERQVYHLFSADFLGSNEIITSSIVRIELLSFPRLSGNELRIIEDLLEQFVIVPITREIEDLTISLRRRLRIKIPDALIGPASERAPHS